MKTNYVLAAFLGSVLLAGGGCAGEKAPAASVPVSSASGIQIYVTSLGSSSDAILARAKALGISEYKPSEARQSDQSVILYLTVPNDHLSEFEGILAKEANDKIVYGAKSLYGDFADREKPKNGVTNAEIRLIDVRALPQAR